MVFADDEVELCLNDHILNMSGRNVTVIGTFIFDDCGTTTRYFAEDSENSKRFYITFTD